MTQIENKLLDWIQKNLILLFLLIVSILGMVIRISGRTFVSGDAGDFLLPWFDQIKENGGLDALGGQVGNYNIPYQFLIALLTYLPFNKLTLYKGLSIVFDYMLAFGAALLACEVLRKKARSISTVFASVYAAVLFLPTVIFNSAIWAQCDSIYTAFIVFSLLFLMKKYYKAAFAFLGLAFSFKLQTVFILPFFLYYYFSEKKYSLLNFIITVLFFYIPCIPGFLYGRSLLDPIRIYLQQKETYPQMWLNFPSFWVFIGNKYEALSKFAIILTLFILGYGLFCILFRKVMLGEPQQFVEMAVWSVWTCLIFLPAMHERYGYALEILLLVLVFVNKKYFFCISIVEITSILTYGHFLFQNRINIQVLSAFYIAAYLVYSWMIISGKNLREVLVIKSEGTYTR